MSASCISKDIKGRGIHTRAVPCKMAFLDWKAAETLGWVRLDLEAGTKHYCPKHAQHPGIKLAALAQSLKRKIEFQIDEQEKNRET